MSRQETILIVTALLISENGYSLPKNLDIEKILNEQSLVIQGLKKIGMNPIKTGKELKKEMEYPPKTSIGENAPRQCIEKERELGNGIIKCKNGYFQAN